MVLVGACGNARKKVHRSFTLVSGNCSTFAAPTSVFLRADGTASLVFVCDSDHARHTSNDRSRSFLAIFQRLPLQEANSIVITLHCRWCSFATVGIHAIHPTVIHACFWQFFGVCRCHERISTYFRYTIIDVHLRPYGMGIKAICSTVIHACSWHLFGVCRYHERISTCQQYHWCVFVNLAMQDRCLTALHACFRELFSVYRAHKRIPTCFRHSIVGVH